MSLSIFAQVDAGVMTAFCALGLSCVVSLISLMRQLLPVRKRSC